MTSVTGLKAIRSFGLALALTAGLAIAASSGAQADATGFTPAGSRASSDTDKPVKYSSRGVVNTSSKKWRYRYCDHVWAYPKNGSIRVEIENTDGSTLWYEGDTETASVYQEMMMRACSRSGAYYGIRFTDVSKGKWDAIVAY